MAELTESVVWQYLAHDDVVNAWTTDTPHYGRTASGYGAKIPMRYMLRLASGRTHRVYVMQYGNSGTPYIVCNGVDRILTANTKSLLERIGS